MYDIKSHWEKIYSAKSPLELPWRQKEPSLSLELIRNAQIALDAPVIDIGGGSSTLVDYLLDEGRVNIEILDISAKALAYAQERLGDKADGIKWREEDATRFEPQRLFYLWHDRAVFHFLTDKPDRRNYVNVLKRALALNGHLIISAFAIGGPTKCSGLDLVQYDAEKLMPEIGEGFELVEDRNETHITPAKKEQPFTYFHFIRKS